jgi:Cu(I)/Ag(I) efflux system membrane protein CusA/SilA
VLELGEAEYMVRASGYLKTLDDFRKVPLSQPPTPASAVRWATWPRIQVGPEMRRGIGELDGEGEATGGVIVMRSGKNALETIAAVKAKLASLQGSLPKGVEIVPTYDRSSLIERAVENLRHKLIEEFIVVALVCAVFLFHLRSALRGHRRRCRWASWRPSSSCATRASTPTSCRWAASPSPSARWSTRPW